MAPRRSQKKAPSKPLSQIFQELEAQAVRESRRPGPPPAGEEASSSSSAMEWETQAAHRARPPGPPKPRGEEAEPGPVDSPSGPPAAENHVVFHCQGCFAVLGDSVHLCRDESRLLGVLVLSRITNNVILDKSLLVGLEGALLGSSYNPLFCHSCGLSVGFRLYSSYATLSDLKGLFCLFKKNVTCYLLKTKSIVNASEMEFPVKHLNEQISKIAIQFWVADHVAKMTKVKREVEELEAVLETSGAPEHTCEMLENLNPIAQRSPKLYKCIKKAVKQKQI